LDSKPQRFENAQIGRNDAEFVVRIAARAPSIYNTQPWRWEVARSKMLLLANWSRQLPTDPQGRSLLVSCGAALALTEIGLSAAGFTYETVRCPRPSDDLLAEFCMTGRCRPDPDVNELIAAASRRRTDRREITRQPVTLAVADEICAAASGPCIVAEFRKGYSLSTVRTLDELHPLDGAIIHWLTKHHAAEGLVIFTESNSQVDQLVAGEAMMRAMLRAEIMGAASCPVSPALDLNVFRDRLQVLMAWPRFPQVFLRVGYPPAGGPAPEPTERHAVSALLRLRG
jgi:nitroreductase